MIQRVKQFFKDIQDLENKVTEILAIEEERQKILTAEPLTDLLRHTLGSINLKDIPESETGESLKAKQGQIAAIFKNVIEPDIKRFIQEQLEFVGKQAANWDQNVFGRGTINGLSLLLEKWEADFNAHRLESQPKPDFDPHKQFPE